MTAQLHLGDCLDVMRGMADASVDAVVCDPPYGLAFMGKEWDHGVPGVAFWTEALRVAKPGAHILAFGGTRTYHRLACAIEDAGWRIVDCLSWLYGSGFPKHKSLLKPAWEPVVMGAKAGARVVNVDACRLTDGGSSPSINRRNRKAPAGPGGAAFNARVISQQYNEQRPGELLGRWPANVCLDEAAAAMLDEQSGVLSSGFMAAGTTRSARSARSVCYGAMPTDAAKRDTFADSGGASRFFYVAKASRSEREAGLDSHEIVSLTCDVWEQEDRKVQLRVDAAVSPLKAIAAYTTEESAASAWSTFLFGSRATGLSRLDTKSTTVTVTSSTTESKILSLLLRSLTSANTVVASGAALNGGSRAASAEPSTPFLTITNGQLGSILGAGIAPSATRLTISASGERVASHPTVKPVALMCWLVRLVTPPDGTILDPFMGSGTTGIACVREGRSFIGIEREPEYYAIAEARIAHARGEAPVNAEQPALDFGVGA